MPQIPIKKFDLSLIQNNYGWIPFDIYSLVKAPPLTALQYSGGF
jgi:hypothetical protein